jgi:hypothetical protein
LTFLLPCRARSPSPRLKECRSAVACSECQLPIHLACCEIDLNDESKSKYIFIHVRTYKKQKSLGPRDVLRVQAKKTEVHNLSASQLEPMFGYTVRMEVPAVN